jgi:hypothetical protein
MGARAVTPEAAEAMTDQLSTQPAGRRARWTMALMIAPGAAAVFGASTAWAMHASPAVGKPPVAPVVHTAAPPKVASAAAVLALQHSASANRRQLAGLQAQLAKLQHQLHELSLPPALVPGAGNSAGGSTAGSAGNQTATVAGPANPPVNGPAIAAPAQAAAAPAQAPAQVAAQPPAPAPPPVQTTTGASGAPK